MPDHGPAVIGHHLADSGRETLGEPRGCLIAVHAGVAGVAAHIRDQKDAQAGYGRFVEGRRISVGCPWPPAAPTVTWAAHATTVPAWWRVLQLAALKLHRDRLTRRQLALVDAAVRFGYGRLNASTAARLADLNDSKTGACIGRDSPDAIARVGSYGGCTS